jgi:RHS repeat-associated protein
MTRNNQSYWYGFEGIGTVRQLMGSQGQVVDAYAFDAWGNEITNPQSQIPNPFKYVGKHGYYLDTESALMLLGMRYYGANMGRFLTTDPLKFFHYPYLYSSCNPAGRVDPTGLTDCPIGFRCDESTGLCTPYRPYPNWICKLIPGRQPWEGDPRYDQFWDCVTRYKKGSCVWEYLNCVRQCVDEILSAPDVFVDWLCAAACGISLGGELCKRIKKCFIDIIATNWGSVSAHVPAPIPHICAACTAGYGIGAIVSLWCFSWCKTECDASYPAPGFYERWCFLQIFGVPLPRCGKPYPYLLPFYSN